MEQEKKVTVVEFLIRSLFIGFLTLFNKSIRVEGQVIETKVLDSEEAIFVKLMTAFFKITAIWFIFVSGALNFIESKSAWHVIGNSLAMLFEFLFLSSAYYFILINHVRTNSAEFLEEVDKVKEAIAIGDMHGKLCTYLLRVVAEKEVSFTEEEKLEIARISGNSYLGKSIMDNFYNNTDIDIDFDSLFNNSDNEDGET